MQVLPRAIKNVKSAISVSPWEMAFLAISSEAKSADFTAPLFNLMLRPVVALTSVDLEQLL